MSEMASGDNNPTSDLSIHSAYRRDGHTMIGQ